MKRHATQVLSIEVAAARGLAAMDSGGTSDPYTKPRVLNTKIFV